MIEARELLGLGGILPGPGWMVLDAARTYRFTGELIMRGDTEVRVYLDRGRIYVAERSTDPSLGARLVAAGALNESQLDYGTLRVGDIEHLGRLFDRVPSISRDGVLAVNQLMTDECVRSVAAERVVSVDATPYRHHPSGMHRWEVIREVEASLASEVPEMALPAPAPDARPVAVAPPAEYDQTTIPADPAAAGAADTDDASVTTGPSGIDATTAAGDEPVTATPSAVDLPHEPDGEPDAGTEPDRGADDDEFGLPIDALFDDLVRWDEPSRVDPSTTITPRRDRSERVAAAPVVDTISDDWIDRLDERGVADAPVGAPVGRLAPVAVRAQEHFEMVWPSGETIDVVPTQQTTEPDVAATPEPDVDRGGLTARLGTAPVADDAPTSTEPETSELAIRRAVATIDTGSLEARRRLVDAASPPMTGTAPDLPGRLAMRSEHIARSTTAPTSTTSVFDEVPAEIPELDSEPSTTSTDDRHGRAGALRRLIGHLRGS